MDAIEFSKLSKGEIWRIEPGECHNIIEAAADEIEALRAKLDNADAAIQDTRRRIGALLDGTARLGGHHTYDEELADIHRCLGLPSLQRNVPDTSRLKDALWAAVQAKQISGEACDWIEEYAEKDEKV